METEQRFNLAPQFVIAAAGFVQKGVALRRFAFQRLLQYSINLSPAFGRHVIG